MRDLKFKVWDKVNAQFVDTIGLALDLFDGELCCSFVDALYVGDLSRDPQDFELLQYTGLKDANGVEIYESDILQDGLHEQMVIRFEAPSFIAVDLEDEMRFTLDRDDLKRVKVIGNIHEHPALLK